MFHRLCCIGRTEGSRGWNTAIVGLSCRYRQHSSYISPPSSPSTRSPTRISLKLEGRFQLSSIELLCGVRLDSARTGTKMMPTRGTVTSSASRLDNVDVDSINQDTTTTIAENNDANPENNKQGDVPAPKIGVGVVVLRHLEERSLPEVLMIRRGTPPRVNWWSFPGGKQEGGETIVACAVREAEEETGVRLLCRTEWMEEDAVATTHQDSPSAHLVRQLKQHGGVLSHPVPFTAVDVISVGYHYAVVEVAAVPVDARQEIQADDDAAAVAWVPVETMADGVHVRFHLPHSDGADSYDSHRDGCDGIGRFKNSGSGDADENSHLVVKNAEEVVALALALFKIPRSS